MHNASEIATEKIDTCWTKRVEQKTLQMMAVVIHQPPGIVGEASKVTPFGYLCSAVKLFFSAKLELVTTDISNIRDTLHRTKALKQIVVRPSSQQTPTGKVNRAAIVQDCGPYCLY